MIYYDKWLLSRNKMKNLFTIKMLLISLLDYWRVKELEVADAVGIISGLIRFHMKISM